MKYTFSQSALSQTYSQSFSRTDWFPPAGCLLDGILHKVQYFCKLCLRHTKVCVKPVIIGMKLPYEPVIFPNL